MGEGDGRRTRDASPQLESTGPRRSSPWRFSSGSRGCKLPVKSRGSETWPDQAQRESASAYTSADFPLASAKSIWRPEADRQVSAVKLILVLSGTNVNSISYTRMLCINDRHTVPRALPTARGDDGPIQATLGRPTPAFAEESSPGGIGAGRGARFATWRRGLCRRPLTSPRSSARACRRALW